MIVKPLFALALLAGAVPATAATAPRVSIATVADLAQPLPLPYDATADADARVATALKAAKTARKRLIIDLGGNWCTDCRVLAGIMAVPELKTFIDQHFEVVTVDVGRMDKNLQIPGHYGVTKLDGVPALLIVDPTKDKLVNGGRLFALSDARHMTPQALADWLAQWAA